MLIALLLGQEPTTLPELKAEKEQLEKTVLRELDVPDLKFGRVVLRGKPEKRIAKLRAYNKGLRALKKRLQALLEKTSKKGSKKDLDLQDFITANNRAADLTSLNTSLYGQLGSLQKQLSDLKNEKEGLSKGTYKIIRNLAQIVKDLYTPVKSNPQVIQALQVLDQSILSTLAGVAAGLKDLTFVNEATGDGKVQFSQNANGDLQSVITPLTTSNSNSLFTEINSRTAVPSNIDRVLVKLPIQYP